MGGVTKKKKKKKRDFDAVVESLNTLTVLVNGARSQRCIDGVRSRIVSVHRTVGRLLLLLAEFTGVHVNRLRDNCNNNEKRILIKMDIFFFVIQLFE